jgi:hypothetical protein
MNTNGQLFWNKHSASTACLGGVGRVHGNYLNTSLFRFVFKHLPEPPKTSVVRGQGKAFITIHKGERKILDCNQISIANKASTYLVKVIRALVCNSLVQAGDLLISLLLMAASCDLPGSVTRKTPQLRKVSSQPAWVVDQFACRERGEMFQANVNADLLAGQRALCYGFRQVEHQADIPAVIDLLNNYVLELCFSGQYPVITHSQFAYILNVEAPLPVLILAQLAPVAIRVLDAFEAILTFEARKTMFLSRLQAPKESGKGFIQSAKKLLQAGHIQYSKGIGIVVA